MIFYHPYYPLFVPFVNPEHWNTNSKDVFVLKKQVSKFCFKDFWYTKIYLSQKKYIQCYNQDIAMNKSEYDRIMEISDIEELQPLHCT